MSGNPYQPPDCESIPPQRHCEWNSHCHRRLVSVGSFLLLAYNIESLCFMTLFSIGAPLQVLGRRGLPVPGFLSHCIDYLMMPLIPFHVLLPFSNAYVIGLTLWLLARRKPEWSWPRRLFFTMLVFVPVWGLRRFRHLFGSEQTAG